MDEEGQTGVVGRNYGVRYTASRLWVTRQTPDGPLTVLEVPIEQVLAVAAGPIMESVDEDDDAEPEDFGLLITLADPSLELDDTVLDRNPVIVIFDLSDEELVRQTARELMLHVYRSRRIHLDLPDTTVPPIIQGPRGLERPDLSAAIARVHGVSRHQQWALLPPEIRADEFVLEVAPVRNAFMVATTLRVFEVAFFEEEVTETPIDAVMAADIEDESSRKARLRLDFGMWTFSSRTGADPRDLHRIVQAITFAISRRRDQWAQGSAQPDSRVLSHEWEALRHQVELDMLGPEEFHRKARGVLCIFG